MLLRVCIQLLYCVHLFKLEYWLCICEHLQFELQNIKFCYFLFCQQPVHSEQTLLLLKCILVKTSVNCFVYKF